MKNILKNKNTFFRISLLILFVLLLQVSITYVGLKEILIQEDKEFIKEMIKIIKNDMKYTNGQWDTTLYNSNPLTPYPNASSTFPLYVITSDGFVIERSKPINGYLDTSDLKQLLEFETPETINTVTNEKWRILSKPVIVNGNTVGAVVVSYYNPEDQIIESIDKKLDDNLKKIEKSVHFENNQLLVKDFDVRNIDYSVSFEVVNKFNKLVINNGRLPAFIDPSYVNNELNNTNLRTINDLETSEEFVVRSEAIYDDNGNPIGIVVVGKSIEPINRTLADYILLTFIIAVSLTLPIIVVTLIILRWEIKEIFADSNEPPQKTIKKLSFDAKSGTLIVDEETIEIPHDTNQYYLSKAIFGSPKRKWEHDELLEKLGEGFDNMNTRKIYDTMNAINKKSGVKLIIYADKKYSLDPRFLEILT